MTSRQVKSLVILFVMFCFCLCIYGGVSYVSAWAASGQESEKTTPIIQFNVDDLADISYVRGDEHFSFSCFNGFWTYDNDPDVAVSQDFMLSLSLVLSCVEPTASVSDPNLDLSQYGLDASAISVTLTMLDGTEVKFFIGDRNPRTLDYYIMLDGEEDTVFLVDYSIGKSFEYEIDEIS